MSYVIFDILKTSIYISIPIILIALLKDKILSKYTYKLNYILCILITLRMLFISNIEIYLPFEFLKTQNNTTLKSIYYINNENSSSLNYVKILFVIWIFGTLYVIFRNIYKQIIFYKKIKNIAYKVTDDNIINSFEEEKKALNIKRNIDVFKVDGLSSPALINILSSKIIIPNKDYDKKQLKWIFRHELTHFKRKDNLLKLFLMIACAIHWFNPLIKIIKIYFHEQCELSCDEKVLKKSNINDIKEYALVLVSTLRYRNTLKSNMLYSQFNTNQIDLIKRRVEGMMNLKKRKKGTLITLFLCGISTLSILSFNLIYKQNTAYANQSEINNEIDPKSNENSQVRPKIITDEELKNNLKKVKRSDVKDEMEFYQDRKFDELTQKEVDYAIDFLFTGKCKRVLVGSDVSYSINTDSLYKDNNN
ncbi:M56 family metallopeptidase [Clostridium sp. CCUG 7971]|uniref:M56 family metallopeptidase n=1 Tax=Clostridium sp. CCUG 7971 TaxID=2811414 RepID=UPI001ABA0E12|nr:M56 family metallopeptidase [Clostridium sp. CCUG 7971]MBO3443864.1 M56 family metallopeptidase [Clostridium sp. CCUG 7971]